MYGLIEFFQPIDKMGYKIVKIPGRISKPKPKADPPAVNKLLGLFRDTDWASMAALRLFNGDEGDFVLERWFRPAIMDVLPDEEDKWATFWPKSVELGDVDALVKHLIDEYTDPCIRTLIVGISGQTTLAPAHSDPNFRDAFIAFARSPDTEEGILAFVNRCGLPWQVAAGALYGFAPGVQTIDLEYYNRYKGHIQLLLRHKTDGDAADYLKKPLEHIHLRISSKNPQKRARLVFEPEALHDFMVLQYSLMVTSNSEIEYAVCKYCDLYFSRGPGTERRTSAVYCSDKCRDAANYRKKKARKAAKTGNKGASA